MSALNKSFLNTVIYIYPNKKLAEAGEKMGGSGFLVGIEPPLTTQRYLYAVTNDHILGEIKALGCTSLAIRFNTMTGGVDVIETEIDQWEPHPDGDDLAVCLLEPSSQWRFNYLTPISFVRKKWLGFGGPDATYNDLDLGTTADGAHKVMEVPTIGVSQETLTIGRYGKHGGTFLNLPAARFGHISMLPVEAVYQAKRNFDQHSYLVETHSINGLSGSPVFIQEPVRMRLTSAAGQIYQHEDRTFLLGIDWGHFDFEGEIIDTSAKTIKVPSGMMCVVPAWKLDELLHVEKLQMQRKELDKELEKKPRRVPLWTPSCLRMC